MSPSQLVEFLLLLLIAASIIAFAAHRSRIPYTIALVLGGFGINLFHVSIPDPGAGGGKFHFLSPDVVFILFLPALLFEAGINLNFRSLRSNLVPILVLAVGGVTAALIATGFAIHWLIGLPLISGLLFGSLIAATDPVAVLALFRSLGVDRRLAMLIEGESLFNDGTAIVLFQILISAAGTGAGISIGDAVRQFVVVSFGGAALGLAFGYAASRITGQIDDARVEITLSMIVAYGTYLLAEHLNVSGVIATVLSGLTMGTYGARVGMSPRTRVALWAYWDYLSFVVNSLLFLLIGIEVGFADLLAGWRSIAIAIAVVLVSRAVAVYGLIPLSNLATRKISFRWQTLAVWGGLHGGVSIALAMSLRPDIPERATILTMTFGVVAFSIIGQGLTLKPALRLLGITADRESDHDRIRVQAIAVKAAERELDELSREALISPFAQQRLREELESRLANLRKEIAEVEARDPESLDRDIRHARVRLLHAEKSSIHHAANQGLISSETAEAMARDADRNIDELRS